MREETWGEGLLKSQDEKGMLQNAQPKGLGDGTGRGIHIRIPGQWSATGPGVDTGRCIT